MAQKKIVQTAGRDQLGEFAPEFARLNDDILFGEVWSRNDLLSLRDRSLVTLTSQPGHHRLIAHLPLAGGQEERHHKNGNIGNHYPYSFLRRMAQGLGGIPPGQRGLEGRHVIGRRRSPLPAGNDFPDWRAEH